MTKENHELIAELKRDYLEANGYETDLAFDGIIGEQKAKTEKYDAILLDVMLPGKTGFDVCRELRKSLRMPIIMVTAQKKDIDKIRGLGLGGADDYLVKPFSPTELAARVKSHIYIHNLLSSTEEEKEQETEITYRNLTILTKSRRVYLDKKEVILVNKEFELLLLLTENPNLVFSKDTLFDRVWGMDSLREAATVTVHINRLRDKLGKMNQRTSLLRPYGAQAIGFGLIKVMGERWDWGCDAENRRDFAYTESRRLSGTMVEGNPVGDCLNSEEGYFACFYMENKNSRTKAGNEKQKDTDLSEHGRCFCNTVHPDKRICGRCG